MEPTVVDVLRTPIPTTPTTPATTPAVLTQSAAIPMCPACHIHVRPTDYFCFNCGHNLHPKPLSTSLEMQVAMYAGSLLLPPMGIIWGFRYVRQKEPVAKMVGAICIILTIIILIIATKLSVDLINKINSQVDSQMQNIQQF